jgi:hypothetical protein
MPDHDHKPPPVEYRDAHDGVLSYQRPPGVEPPRGRNGEGLLGCLSTAVLIPVGVVVIAFAQYANVWPDWVAFSMIGMLFAVPLAVGLALRRMHRWQALAVGLLFGLGIAALIEGICFVGAWM